MDTSKTFASRVERIKQQVEAGQPINPHDLLAAAEIVLLLGNWCQTMNSSMVNQLEILGDFMKRFDELEERVAEVEEFAEDMSEDLDEVEELLGLADDDDGEEEEEAEEADEEYDLEWSLYEVEVDGKDVDVLFLHDADVSVMTDGEFNDFVQTQMEDSESEIFTAVVVDINEIDEMEEEPFNAFLEDLARTAIAGATELLAEETIAEKHF